MGRPRKEPKSDLEKLAEKIGSDGAEIIAELESAYVESLNKRVVQATEAINDTAAKLKEHPEYIQAKEDLKLLSSGLREVKKRQNAIIKVCLQIRKDRGEA